MNSAAPPTGNPLDGLLDALVDRLAERLAPRVADILASRASKGAPEPVTTGLVSKTVAARAIAMHTATLDRFTREGAPVHYVGSRRRYLITELRVWLEARGRKPATRVGEPIAGNDDAELEEIARAAGLRRR